jgi:hypothetical protein
MMELKLKNKIMVIIMLITYWHTLSVTKYKEKLVNKSECI